MKRFVELCWAATVAVAAGGSALANDTIRVSVANDGTQANWPSGRWGFAMSADGRYVAFSSDATNLIAGGDTNDASDVFLRDLQGGTTELINVVSFGSQADADGYRPSISADGRCVAFASGGSNLVAGDTNQWEDVFVRDRLSGTTERVSVATGGGQANRNSEYASISADGRFVVFMSAAFNLVAGDTNGETDVFVHDRSSGVTERVSVSTAGVQANDGCIHPMISGDGRYVAFTSRSSVLVAGDANGSTSDVFVRDRLNGTTEIASLANGGAQANSWSDLGVLSADGRYVGFRSEATNLVAGDTNGMDDVFLRDRQSGMTQLVSIAAGGLPANDRSLSPCVSADGRFVAFTSRASNLVASDINLNWDAFVRDMQSGTTERVSSFFNPAQGDGGNYPPQFDQPERRQVVSADGRYVAFESGAAYYVSGDTNNQIDVFVRDRDNSGFPSHCEPGSEGILACPCSNPPSGPGRGCDNSAATGGASLAASGVAQLSADSLVFTTSGEKPTAASIVLQGDALHMSGVSYGQGVRCPIGILKRLYVKTAVAGSITAPGPGDPSVSQRSAALGDTIPSGANRAYMVYYRDPIVLGGCTPDRTFNATQTRHATWVP